MTRSSCSLHYPAFKSETFPGLSEEVRECGLVSNVDVTGHVRPLPSIGNPQRSLDVSRTIGKAPGVSEVRIGVDQRIARLRRRDATTHRCVKARESVPVEQVKKLHAEIGVDPLSEHGDSLGDVEVLTLIKQLADTKSLGRVAKGEVGGRRKGIHIQ